MFPPKELYLCLCAQSCLTLSDPVECSLPGSSVHGVPQARTLGWVAIPVSCMAGGFFNTPGTCAAKSLQSCPTLQPIDGSPPGSAIPGILQARTLEWVAISFSRFLVFSQSCAAIPTA